MALTVTVLMAAAHNFRRSLPAEAQDIFKHIAYQDALSRDEDPNDANDGKAGLEGLYDRCDLGAEVSEEIFSALEVDVQDLEGLGSIDRKIFQQVLKRLDNTKPGSDRSHSLESCHYGNRLNVAIAQQSLRRNETILLDLLALIAFMSGDLEPSELHPDFAPRKLYNEIIELLKQTSLRLWLASHTRMEPSPDGTPAMIEATLLESFFAGDWKRIVGTEHACGCHTLEQRLGLRCRPQERLDWCYHPYLFDAAAKRAVPLGRRLCQIHAGHTMVYLSASTTRCSTRRIRHGRRQIPRSCE
jgi:hypothetical protein